MMTHTEWEDIFEYVQGYDLVGTGSGVSKEEGERHFQAQLALIELHDEKFGSSSACKYCKENDVEPTPMYDFDSPQGKAIWADKRKALK